MPVSTTVTLDDWLRSCRGGRSLHRSTLPVTQRLYLNNNVLYIYFHVFFWHSGIPAVSYE